MDKNFPPAEVKSTIAALPSNVTPIALLPKSSPTARNPFSLTYLLQCYTRCLSREDHPTLSSEDPVRLLKILILFYKQFDNLDLKTLLPQSIPVEMTTQMQMPSDLEHLIADSLKSGADEEEAIEDAVIKI